MQHLPVHWYEGLFIRPHHFQAAERHWNEWAHLADHCYHAYNYGLRSIEVNEDAVPNYQFQVASCLARMVDGTLVSFKPGQEPDRVDTKPALSGDAQQRRNLDEAFSSETNVTVYLAVPKLEMGRANVYYPGSQNDERSDERFVVRTNAMAEASRGGGVQEIELLTLNTSLVATSSRQLSGYELLPVARLKRAGEETSLPQIDSEYIPPLLAIDAWPRLAAEIEGLYHYLGENIDTLSRQIISRRITLASQEPGDLERVFKLRTLNEAYAALRCLIFASGIHPYHAYSELCRYVGMLAIFSEERRVPDCPVYDHDDLGRIFPWVIQRIKELVESGGKWEYEMRYFKGAGRGVEVTLERKWLNPDWDWYVGVNPGGLSEASCHTLLTSEGTSPDDRGYAANSLDWKIGSAAQVEELFRGRRPGLNLLRLPQAPRALPAGRGWIYYSVTREGSAWTGVQADGTLAMRFNEKLIHNLDNLQDERTLVVSWRGRPANLQFALFAVPKY